MPEGNEIQRRAARGLREGICSGVRYARRTNAERITRSVIDFRSDCKLCGRGNSKDLRRYPQPQICGAAIHY